MPKAFSWGNVNGTSFLSKSLNQHIPQYCGSCWAHGSASALTDRIKIARGVANGPDINLAIQFILNCGADVAGSCHGGSASGVYDFVKNTAEHWPFDTCMQYAACSADSTEGACAAGNWTCSAVNTCRTCSTFSSEGGFCSGIDQYPNVRTVRGNDADDACCIKLTSGFAHANEHPHALSLPPSLSLFRCL